MTSPRQTIASLFPPHLQTIEIVEKTVAQQSGDVDPLEFIDCSEDALHALIEEKKKAA